MQPSVDTQDEIRAVAMVLDYLSNTTKDEGLAFILDNCVERLTLAVHGSQHGTEYDDTPFD